MHYFPCITCTIIPTHAIRMNTLYDMCSRDRINIYICIAMFAHVCGLYTKLWRNPLRVRTLVNRILLIPTRMGFPISVFLIGRSIGCPLVTKLRELIIYIWSMNYETQYIRYTSAICNKMNACQQFVWLQEHVEN